MAAGGFNRWVSLRELFTSPDRMVYCVDAIKRLEHVADEITHDVATRLDRTFITLVDHKVIHLLASDLDDVIDGIDSTARRAQVFRFGDPPDGVVQLCDLICRITGDLKVAVGRLRAKSGLL